MLYIKSSSLYNATTDADLTHSDVQTFDNKLCTFLLLLLSDVLYALSRNFQKQMFYCSDCMGNVSLCSLCEMSLCDSDDLYQI